MMLVCYHSFETHTGSNVSKFPNHLHFLKNDFAKKKNNKNIMLPYRHIRCFPEFNDMNVRTRNITLNQAGK